jgi:hypothetical protein
MLWVDLAQEKLISLGEVVGIVLPNPLVSLEHN